MAEQMYPNLIEIAYTPEDAERIHNSGKLVAGIGIENGWVIGKDLTLIKRYYDLGARYMTLAHTSNNDICDSSTDTAEWGGLSPFGEQVVKEMNRLGIIVDISHVSDDTVRDVLRITDVPVIASHSGLRHFTPEFNRNMPDDIAKAVAKKGGVIQLAFGTAFLDRKQSAETMERRRKVGQMEKDGKTQAEIEAYSKAFSASHPAPVLHTDAVLDQIDYAVKLVGIDHVGIGSDFDGVDGELPVELKSVADYPNLGEGLQKRGYKDADIRKILGGNLLRVWGEIEKAAAK